MNVHRVNFEVERFQSLIVDDPDLLGTDAMRFDGVRKAETWVPPRVYSPDLRLAQGDFWHLWGCAVLVCSPRAAHVVERMSVAVELLPLPFARDMLFVVNVTEQANCLDHEKSVWALAEDGTPLYPELYQFHRQRLPGSTLFKIPETAAAEVLCHDGALDPADEFRHGVERHGLTGLRFEKLWEAN